MDIMTIKSRIKEIIKLKYIYPEYHKIFKSLKNNYDSRIILFGTPAHGNLGDQAIAISELDFLQKISKNREIIEIPMPLFKTYRHTIKRYLTQKDTIIISGGGWMGNLWIHNEITIRQIIKDYPKNRVVIFPQTVYYTNDEAGKNTIIETRNVFCKHKDLILSVRDEKSYKCAEKELRMKPNQNLVFCPDMVVYGTLAKKNTVSQNNKVALLCLRKDVEKNSNTDHVMKVLADGGYSIKETTTVLNHLIPLETRLDKVEAKLSEFQSASIVVTDRLHAMLFAALTGTPCFAFDNATGKVFGVGKYLIENGFSIKLVHYLDASDLENLDLTKREYRLSKELNEYYMRLADIVNTYRGSI